MYTSYSDDCSALSVAFFYHEYLDCSCISASFVCIERFQIEPKPSDDEPSDDLAESVVPAQDTELKMLEGELASIQELSFAFRRAASRLVEISSVEYGRRR